MLMAKKLRLIAIFIAFGLFYAIQYKKDEVTNNGSTIQQAVETTDRYEN